MSASNRAPRAAPFALLGPALACAVLPAGAWGRDAESPAETNDDPARVPIIVTGHAAAAANPNADPEARYKIERSTNDKFTENVRDTPRSMTMIPKEVLEDTGSTGFRDVARTTPGVTLGTGEGRNAFGDRIFIRGFEARNDVYIDGMRDPGVSSRETFAVEQIEVFKGASSAYGGSGTTGGLVSLESKKALDRTFEVVEAGIGNDSYSRRTVDANNTLTDTLALRVNGLFHDADTPGRNDVYQRRTGGAAALDWMPTPTVTVDAEVYHYAFTGMSDYGIRLDPRSGRPFAVDPGNIYGAVGRGFIDGEANVGTLTLRWRPSEAVALPHAIYPPLFNRYGPGDRFDLHVDNAVRVVPGSGVQMRADLSATLFLSDDYGGGALTVETPGGEQGAKLPAGSLVLYPSTTRHRVTEVTRGVRLAAFFWVQSLVRDATMRETLHDLDRATQALAAERGKTDPQVLRLAKVYHNLVRASAL